MNFSDLKKVICGNEKLATIIKEYRKKYKLTQKELADMLGVTVITVKRYESGGNMLFEKLAHITKILKIDPVLIFSVCNLNPQEKKVLLEFYDMNKSVDELETLKKYITAIGYFCDLKYKTSSIGSDLGYWEFNDGKNIIDINDGAFDELNSQLKKYIKKFILKNKINLNDLDYTFEDFENSIGIIKIKEKLKNNEELDRIEKMQWEHYHYLLSIQNKTDKTQK